MVLNANPSFDTTVLVDNIRSSGILRGKEVYKYVDGKGMGVSRTLMKLGNNDYKCLNILGGYTGEAVFKFATKEGLKVQAFWISQETRINTILLSEKNDTLVINEPGPALTSKEISEFKEWLRSSLNASRSNDVDYFVISGSFPRGFNSEDFDEVLSIADDCGYNVVVDIAKTFLNIALKHGVWLVKVNEYEIAEISNNAIDPISFVQREYGVKNVVITTGSKGSFGNVRGIPFKTTISNPEKRYAVGSGDAYLGGLIHGISTKIGILNAVRLATACGAANTEKIGPCIFDKEHIKIWLDRTKVEEVIM